MNKEEEEDPFLGVGEIPAKIFCFPIFERENGIFQIMLFP